MCCRESRKGASDERPVANLVLIYCAISKKRKRSLYIFSNTGRFCTVHMLLDKTLTGGEGWPDKVIEDATTASCSPDKQQAPELGNVPVSHWCGNSITIASLTWLN